MEKGSQRTAGSFFAVKPVQPDKTCLFGFELCGILFTFVLGMLFRFKQKRSNFAEYNEPITELPTFVSQMRHVQGVGTELKFGENYWMIFESFNAKTKQNL